MSSLSLEIGGGGGGGASREGKPYRGGCPHFTSREPSKSCLGLSRDPQTHSQGEKKLGKKDELERIWRSRFVDRMKRQTISPAGKDWGEGGTAEMQQRERGQHTFKRKSALAGQSPL